MVDKALKGNNEDDEEDKVDLIGVMLTSKKLGEPLKQYEQS